MMDIFKGIRVLDLASFVAAPAAATLLADYGADVIKIEPPIGDMWRNVTPNDRPNSIWHLTSRNKRSIVLDLKDTSQRAVLLEMVRQADVLVHNFRPQKVADYGLAYADLRATNKRLIYAYMNGFGDRGPDADKRGFDTTAWFARCGILHMMHDKGVPPPWPVIGLGDHFTAMTLFAGIAAALYRREQEGDGCEVGTSLVATGVWGNGVQIQNALGGHDPAVLRDADGWTNPFGSVYQTMDNKFILFILSNRTKEWPALARALDLDNLVTDELFSTQQSLSENASKLKPLIAAKIRALTLAQLAPKLDGSSIAWSEIQDHEQIAKDPQVLENDVIVPTTTDDERINASISAPLKFNGSIGRHRQNAPALGEHNSSVFRELGIDTSIAEN